MYKKLLSNLPFNPSLLGQVYFYAKRLHREERLLRTGVIMVVLAVLIQMFAIISPPKPTLASSDNDIIRGGFSNHEGAIMHCVANTQNFRTILAYYGITCDMLAKNASTETIRSTDYNKRLDSMGRRAQGQYIDRTGKPTNEYPVSIAGAGTFYMRNLWAWDSGAYSSYKVLKVTNPQGDVIMIMYSCGNIVTVDRYSPPPPPPPPPPTPVKVVACGSLNMSISNNSQIKTGTTVRVWGVATGRNLDPNERADMYYDVVDVVNGDREGPEQIARGIPFTNGIARDSGDRSYTFNKAGSYRLRLAVKYNASGTTKNADGNQTGDCIKQITVSNVDVCPDLPGDQTEEEASKCLSYDKSATNQTQNIEDADGTEARAGDVIIYTLTVANLGDTTVKNFLYEENIGDVLEYADVLDLHGGTMDSSKTVSWPLVDIPANGRLNKKITVRVKSVIPQTPTSSSDPGSFDLVMTNVFHDDSVNIKLPGGIVKITEQTVTTLPSTGPGENIAIAASITMVVSYFFARTRLLGKEIELVRGEYASSGGY